jgi:glycosyltransferase involved in cell wall biosynthesis
VPEPASPAVSVIIPVYRGAGFIARTMESLRAQTFCDFEALCIDDCSPDDSAAVIRGLASQDERIRYLKTPRNFGIVPKVMNFAKDHVRGRYFAYSSQDDSFSADWLESMVATAERTDADAVVPNLLIVDDERGVFARKINDWRQPMSGEEAFLLSLDWTIPTNALWRASMLTGIGYADFGTYADEYSGRVFFLECRKVAFAKGEFHYYHGNPDAITKQVSGRLLDDTYNNYRLWRLTHERFPGHEWDHRLAARTLRSLVESYDLLARHRELAPEESRLAPAIAGMNGGGFLASLKASFGGRRLRYQLARMLIRREGSRRIAMAFHFGGRTTKQVLRRLGLRLPG